MFAVALTAFGTAGAQRLPDPSGAHPAPEPGLDVRTNAEPQHESWLGPDKVKHFFMAAFVETVTFSGLEATNASRNAAFAGAVGVTTVISVGREIHDRRTKGLFSLGDLLWDAVGAIAAAQVLRHTQ